MTEKYDKEHTRFERARMIGARALQIMSGAPALVKTKETNAIKIAEFEYEEGKSPLEVKRKMPLKEGK